MAKAHGLKYVHDLHCEKCDLREETNQLFFTISLVLASVVEPEPEPEPGQSWTGSTTLVLAIVILNRFCGFAVCLIFGKHKILQLCRYILFYAYFIFLCKKPC